MNLRDYLEKYRKYGILKNLSVFIGIAGIIFTVIIFTTGVSTGWAGLKSYSLAIIPYSLTVILSIGIFFYSIFKGHAAKEAADKIQLKNEKEKMSAFDISEDARFTAEHTLKNYLKFAPSVISLICIVVASSMIIYFFQFWTEVLEQDIVPENALQTAFVASIILLIGILGGSFLIGQSNEDEYRWLRPAGAWLIMASLNMLLVAIAALSYNFNVPEANPLYFDELFSKILIYVYIILAAEFLINFIIEFYRPRTGEEERPIFESRLLSLFTQPGGVARNIADTMDYQFGFKLSATWFYTFLEKSITPLVIFWVIIFWLTTSIVQIDSYQMGFRERFGRRLSNEVLEPGIYLKLPWPFAEIRRFPVNKVRNMVIGPEMVDAQGNEKRPEVVVWTKSHYAKHMQFVVGTKKSDPNSSELPLSLLSASFPLQYKIDESKLLNYAYNYDNPEEILKSTAEATVAEYLASVDMVAMMSYDRSRAMKNLTKALQKKIDDMKLGIKVVTLNLHDAHPPIEKAAPAYEDVLIAMEEREISILKAKKTKIQEEADAEAGAYEIESLSEAYRNDRVKVAEAEKNRFLKQLEAYLEMPEMFKLRTYLTWLEKDTAEIRKYIMSTSLDNEIYEINLEEDTRLDLIDAEFDKIGK